MPDRFLTWSIIGASTMPPNPTWFHRLPEILDTLRGMDSSHLDRQAVEQLFGVGERRARQLMAGLLGIRAGNAEGIALTESVRTAKVAFPGDEPSLPKENGASSSRIKVLCVHRNGVLW